MNLINAAKRFRICRKEADFILGPLFKKAEMCTFEIETMS